MISNVVLDCQARELAAIERIFHDEAAHLSEEQWQMDFFHSPEAFSAFLKACPLVDMACIDVYSEEAVELLEQFRESYGQAWLMVIADAAISPMKYLKPSIRPGSLLLRPAANGAVRQVIREFIQAFMQSFQGTDQDEASFLVESREGRMKIPYGQIAYFEAREKKIFVRAGSREYGFYDTMEHLLTVLPGHFIRCHRSFIANRDKIEKIVLSQNLVMLEGGLTLPISRSYRAEMRNL